MYHPHQNEENSKKEEIDESEIAYSLSSGFRIADENSKNREYFSCSTRDEMAKWMNKMGLAAINFNMDDSKIGGFHKGFVDSREGSPATTPNMSLLSIGLDKQQRSGHMSSVGDSENESDKESVASWHKSSLSDIEQPRDKVRQHLFNIALENFCLE